MSAPTFTAAELAAEARREAAMRRSVYPKWVETGRMTPAAAERQIALMDRIAADYRRQAEDASALERLV